MTVAIIVLAAALATAIGSTIACGFWVRKALADKAAMNELAQQYKDERNSAVVRNAALLKANGELERQLRETNVALGEANAAKTEAVTKEITSAPTDAAALSVLNRILSAGQAAAQAGTAPSGDGAGAGRVLAPSKA